MSVSKDQVVYRLRVGDRVQVMHSDFAGIYEGCTGNITSLFPAKSGNSNDYRPWADVQLDIGGVVSVPTSLRLPEEVLTKTAGDSVLLHFDRSTKSTATTSTGEKIAIGAGVTVAGGLLGLALYRLLGRK